MKLKIILLGVMLSLISVCGFGQKVKYKDLFLLLNAKQYKEAEPFLKKFLKDNPEHANALLHMGLMYHEKSYQNDVLKETDNLKSNIDTALIYYEKAAKAINEKEIKKNDDYYESYKRRDLRTGDFAVKLSDVQFDLEKRMQMLKERKGRVTSLREYYLASESLYTTSQSRFRAIQDAYPGEKELLLRSDENLVKSLENLIFAFDSSMTAFRSYKSTSQLLGKTGYSQVIALQPIKDFKRDGKSVSNFTDDDLNLWDFKTWAVRIEQIIEKDIAPVREKLITYDVGINKLREKLKRDSVDIRMEVTQLTQKSPVAVLEKIDPGALPGEIFDMKIAELNYGGELVAHRPYRDSLNVNLRLKNVRLELEKLDLLDSLSGHLLGRDIDKESENYKHFVTNGYGTVDVLKSLIKATNDFAKKEKVRKEGEWESTSQALKWIIIGPDSIPLFTELNGSAVKFKPLVIVPDDHTIGLQYADSVATGYFATITSSRVPDVKASFPVEKVHFTRRNLPLIKGLSCRDEKGMVYFSVIYSEAKVKAKDKTGKEQDHYSVIISKIYRSDGLAWSFTYPFEALPVSATLDPASGELSVKVTNAAGESSLVTIDKNGKVIK